MSDKTMRQKLTNEQRWFKASAKRRILSNWNMLFHVQKIMLNELMHKGLNFQQAVKELHHRKRK